MGSMPHTVLSMAFDVAALRAEFPSLASGIAHFDGPGGTQTPRVVGEAIARTLTGPLSNRGDRRPARSRTPRMPSPRSGQAYADLLGADPRGIVYGRSATQLDVRLLPPPGQDLGDRATRSSSAGSTTTPTCGRGCRRPSAPGATVRWVELDPATAELDAGEHRCRHHRPHPARRGDRGIQSARHQAGRARHRRPRPRRRRARLRRRRALRRARAGRRRPRSAPTSSCARRTSSSGRTARCSPPHPRCSRPSRPTSSRRRRTTCPSGSSSARCRTRSWPGVTAAVDFLAGIAPGRATDAPRAAARLAARGRRARAADAAADRGGSRRARRRGDPVVARRRAHARPCSSPSPGRRTGDAYGFLAARDVLAPAGDFYAIEPFRALGHATRTALRMGVAPYTDERDVERLLDGLRDWLAAGEARSGVTKPARVSRGRCPSAA